MEATAQDIVALIRRHEPSLRALGVRSLALFGSCARDEAEAGSDVDLLYEFEEGTATLDHFLDLHELLERLLGRPVDLVPAKHLSPLLEARIRGSILPVLLPAVPQPASTTP